MTTSLLTGSHGFLGSYLYKALAEVGPVHTLGRHTQSDIQADIAIGVPSLNEPIDWVVHNAGKAHIVPRTEAEALDFDSVNRQGTLHLLEALERVGVPRRLVFISTVAVYGLDAGEGITEETPLLGSTPYAVSKIAAEAAVRNWCTQHNVQWVILRLPLVAGPDAPGNLGAMRRAIQRGYYVRIKGNTARRSMVAAADVATLIATLPDHSGIYNLTDGFHPTLSAIEATLERAIGKSIRWNVPLALLRQGAQAGDLLQSLGIPFPLTSTRLQKLSATLTFDDQRAREELGWAPKSALDSLL